MDNNYSSRDERREARRQQWEEHRESYLSNRGNHGHIWTGIFILLVGVAALLKVSIPDLPSWIFTWQMFLIALGLFIGFKHGFRGGAWLILIMIGTAFLLRDIFPDLAIRRYIWPVLLIGIGAFLIVRPRRKSWEQCAWNEKKNTSSQNSSSILSEGETWSQDDFVDSTSIFGGDKKNILSKNFKGGDIVNIFGGTELNFTQADIQGKVTIEITTIFGGTKLIVPSNWEVKSEAVTIFGGLEDKRSVAPATELSGKILLLKGTVIFGGIEIKSF
jgi:predicted membrane protein